VGTSDPMGDSYPHGYGYGGKFIPISVYGWPDKIIFVSWVWVRGIPIVISSAIGGHEAEFVPKKARGINTVFEIRKFVNRKGYIYTLE
jgi:hypothetical protein